MANRRVTTYKIQQMKRRGAFIPMVTAYDYTAARIIDSAGLPMILVGDSMGHVVLGYDSTIPVTVDDIVSASAAVVRGTTTPLIVADMPFLSYQIDAETALRNAARLIQEGGAQAVKLEGGKSVAPIIRRLTEAGLAVMGHIGLTPQHVNMLGGYRVQGKTETTANEILDDALSLQEAGVFSVVLELIPAELAKKITKALDIPTIGIGAGIHCDGQIQVFHDMLGLDPDFRPRHSGEYANLAPIIKDALVQYGKDVREGTFPTDAQSFFSDESRVATPIRDAFEPDNK
ncbi:MAG: 3-methyl-2-oxobutanoate hydroxymethyltransferase [SAR202 cluster bacterium]|nr:3-methyl-2-oxobutanoate hydroxymethyltransferase [SAR202 cluster bacterium]|tara:strand:- start:4961 stop:5824 length:864 start_codon:yes stop_codon:yes gene_type:complete